MERLYKQILASVTPATLEGGWERDGIVAGTVASASTFGVVQVIAKVMLKKLIQSKVG